MTANGPETVSIVATERKGSGAWNPVVGPETTALFEESIRLDKVARRRVTEEARRVLAKCLPPSATSGSETGLVIGYVQSGKTMSFTTVAALARDNQYHLIILIAGTSSYLLDQSTNRLYKDLRIDVRNDRKWLTFQTSRFGAAAKHSLREALAGWADPTLPEAMKRTVLITAMKNHTHLDRLAGELKDLNLRHIRALVIDDEADQASLNADVNNDAESSTYSKLNALRDCLPHHSYLQYTATPQAPLLINIIDTLSPRFAEILTPGEKYVGGKAFFIDNPELVEGIPHDDIPDPKELQRDPPESLHRAMQLFFIGVAAGLIRDRGAGNRSMMVHPSQKVDKHAIYHQWVTAARDTWKQVLDPEQELDADRKDLLEEFERAHRNLSSTVSDLPPWPELRPMIRHAIRETRIEKVNATPDAADEIKWKDAYSWILVGGQAMDRGFTVEGLTVTYMPREVGVGNADTVQQRGRFFGYKRDYLGYCRVFLSAGAKNAFARYVSHEEDVRNRLIAFRDTGKPLSEWKRVFLLAKELRPCRISVLDLEIVRGRSTESWYHTDRPQVGDVKENLEVVTGFRDSLKGLLTQNEGAAERTEYQKHLVAEVPLSRILDEVLPRLRYADPADSGRLTLLSILLGEVVAASPHEMCTVFFMSGWKSRIRGVDAKNAVKNLFQGAAPVEGSRRGSVYPGDREVVQNGCKYALQFHHLRLTRGDKDEVVFPSTVALAFYAASGLGRDLVAQEQPGRRVSRGVE